MSLTAAIERLRYALKMHDEHRTTLQSLASSVGDFLRDYANIAAGQQGAGAEADATFEVDYSKFKIVSIDPKPAGAVPLPEPVAKRSTTHGGEILCEPVYSAEQLRAYGDAREAAAPHALREKLRSCEEALAAAEAREAAGRAVAVPAMETFAERLADAISLIDLSATHIPVLVQADKELRALYRDMKAKPHPIPQQPEAEGACICDGATYAPDQRYPFIVNRACPRHGGATSAAEGTGREAVEAFERLTAMKYANDHDGYCQRLQDIAAIRRNLAHLTPAADAGGVTLEYADRVLSEYVRIQINEHTDRATEEHRVDAMRRALTAALTPEVSHGE